MAASIGLSPYAAVERGDAAQQLAFGGRLAQTGRALAEGLVAESSARLIALALRRLDDEDAAAVEAAVLPHAQVLTHRKLERVVRREIAIQRSARGVLDNEVARGERCVSRPRPGEFGSASLQVIGPAEDIQVLHTALTAIAEATKAAARAPGDQDADSAPEGLDAYRFDALISLACGVLADDTLPTHHGRRPSIAVTVPAAVLLGLSQSPAELEGHGPISAAAARRLAMDPSATWRRILTDPAGLVLDYGTSTYRPPRHLSDLIITRDRTCAFPGCQQPARLTQLDHVVPFPRGSTSAANMGPACGREHNLKTARLFAVARDPKSGATVWTDRHGTSYTRPPERVPTAPEHDHVLRAIAEALATGRAAIAQLRNPVPPCPPAPVMDDDPPPF